MLPIKVITFGIPGMSGPPGKSAYKIAQDNGFEGTEAEWLESLQGGVSASYVNGVLVLDVNGTTVFIPAATANPLP